MIGRHNKSVTTLQQTRRARRARVVRSNIGSNTIKSTHISNTAAKTGTAVIPKAIVIVVVGLIVVWSGYVGNIRIVNAVNKENASAVDQGVTDSIKKIAEEYFQGIHKWWWFVSTEEAIQDIKQENPYVANISISRGLLTRDIIITVEQRSAALRAVVNKRQYLIAHDGVVLGQIYDGDELPIVYDESSGITEVKLGKAYLPSQTVSTILGLKTGLVRNGFKVKDFSLTNNTREVRAHLKNEKYYIKFTTNASVNDQISDLLLVKKQIKGAEYVDVRFSGKVYIR